MLVAAAWEHDLDLSCSFMVGDKATDIDMAHNAGCCGILVQTGYGDRVLGGHINTTLDPIHRRRFTSCG
jgi:D-glycero-D-manno-heptose 1,7-bisphosphate phosphatase